MRYILSPLIFLATGALCSVAWVLRFLWLLDWCDFREGIRDDWRAQWRTWVYTVYIDR